MPTAWVINAVGLAISTIAAVLMYYFPPSVILYTEKGEPHINFVGNSTEKGRRWGKWQLYLSKAAPWLLAFGFFLQLIAAVMPASNHVT